MAKATVERSGVVTWVSDLGEPRVAVASTTSSVQACVSC